MTNELVELYLDNYLYKISLEIEETFYQEAMRECEEKSPFIIRQYIQSKWWIYCKSN